MQNVQIADALSSDEYHPGDAIIHFGDEGEWMFLIVEGTVEIIGRSSTGAPEKICEMSSSGV